MNALPSKHPLASGCCLHGTPMDADCAACASDASGGTTTPGSTTERTPVASSGRDWPEDFSHENGDYMNQCCYCKQTFIGYKRRVVCKACASPPSKVEAVSGGGEAATVEGLPPLPKPDSDNLERVDIDHPPYYTANQMHEYARAALASRLAAQAGGEVRALTDERIEK